MRYFMDLARVLLSDLRREGEGRAMFWPRTWEQRTSTAGAGASLPIVAPAAHIVGAAIGLGARDQRCEHGPNAVRESGVVAALEQAGAIAWAEIVRPHAPAVNGQVAPCLADFSARLARVVHDTLVTGRRACVIGGDHSCAIGTWSGAQRALAPQGALGLVWIDAHMDSHTHETSPSGAVHGMPLACLLGFGEQALTQVAGPAPKLLARNVCVVGVRSFEAPEAALLQHLGVRVFDMNEIRRRGLAPVVAEAVERVQRHAAAFGITIDLDAIDPTDAPGVGTPEPGGIAASDLKTALTTVAGNRRLLGVEIAEFNPARDVDNVTVRLISELLAASIRTEVSHES
jgi:arginase